MADEAPTNPQTGVPPKAKVPWVPLILVLLFIPIITLLLTELVVVPRLRSSMGNDDAAGTQQNGGGTAVAPAAAPATGGSARAGSSGEYTVVFTEIVANLSGTMGTRFMRVSFHVAGRDPRMESLIQQRRPRVQDAIITTLSSKTIQELEAIGGRNSLRVALISAINQAIGVEMVQELYFTEFIIQ